MSKFFNRRTAVFAILLVALFVVIPATQAQEATFDDTTYYFLYQNGNLVEISSEDFEIQCDIQSWITTDNPFLYDEDQTPLERAEAIANKFSADEDILIFQEDTWCLTYQMFQENQFRVEAFFVIQSVEITWTGHTADFHQNSGIAFVEEGGLYAFIIEKVESVESYSWHSRLVQISSIPEGYETVIAPREDLPNGRIFGVQNLGLVERQDGPGVGPAEFDGFAVAVEFTDPLNPSLLGNVESIELLIPTDAIQMSPLYWDDSIPLLDEGNSMPNYGFVVFHEDTVIIAVGARSSEVTDLISVDRFHIYGHLTQDGVLYGEIIPELVNVVRFSDGTYAKVSVQMDEAIWEMPE